MSNPAASFLPVVLGSLSILMLIGCQEQPTPAEPPPPAAAPAKAVPTAEAYYQWLLRCLAAIEKDMPAITRSAEAAAGAYIREGWEIGVWGDAGLAGEFSGRAGGLMRTSPPTDIEKADWKGIILVFPREASLTEDLAKVWGLQRQGKMVFGFLSPRALRAAGDVPIAWSGIIATHATRGGGLFRTSEGNSVVPTDPVANIAAMWTWTGEFVGALTRLGRMPTMHQSIIVPGSRERYEKYKGLKFHAEAPKPVSAGQLGREYLAALRKCLAAVHEQEMGRIAQVAEQAAATLRAGRHAHVFAHGHAIRHHVEVPCDPGFFRQVNRGLFELRDDAAIAKGDFIFCVGYDRIFQGWFFKDAADRMRSAGASLAWSMTDYNQDANTGPAAVPRGEIIVGQHWELGDAAATVPGYDVKVLPPSGVVSEAVFYMTEAQMLGILGPGSPAKYRPKPPAGVPATNP